MSLLECRDVTKTFTEGRQVVEALRGITLGVDRGEIVALEGPSGSGKTTLLCILGCILTPTAGDVWLDGTRVGIQSTGRLARFRRQYVGFVFQHFNLFAPLTARENVEYALNLKGNRGRAARLEAERWLDAVGLTDRRDFLPRDLSGGQKQRVAIARALAGQNPVLLADEPTANLDSQVGAQVLDLFRRLVKQENRSLLVVTHDLMVRQIADRILRIRDGQLTESG